MYKYIQYLDPMSDRLLIMSTRPSSHVLLCGLVFVLKPFIVACYNFKPATGSVAALPNAFTSPSLLGTPMLQPYNASLWSNAYLSAATKGQCSFLATQPFLERFERFNTTLWSADSAVGAQHCTGFAPSGPGTCTMASMDSLGYGELLDNSTSPPTYGLLATISQQACVDSPASCSFDGSGNPGGTAGQAWWMGAHLQSLSCIQYGILEFTARFDISASTGAFFFIATYIQGSLAATPLDRAWNEIDLGLPFMATNTRGQAEFHATVFTSSNATPTTTTAPEVDFTASGGIYTTINTPTLSALNSTYYNKAFIMNDTVAGSWHTYRLAWQPNSMAWYMVSAAFFRVLGSVCALRFGGMPGFPSLCFTRRTNN